MNKDPRSRSWAVIFVLIFLVFAFSVPAQKPFALGPIRDTAKNPHDFTNEYYASNGINPKEIIGRRTGADALSVFGWSSNPNHTSVRVIATLPAYDQNGTLSFWYPLGDIMDNGFTDDKMGAMARETANLFPVYLFPDSNIKVPSIFANRQAALVDDSWRSNTDWNLNPLGLRAMFIVTYTDKAFTKEGIETMAYFGKKNGYAADDTPLIKSVEDMHHLWKNEFIRVDPFYDSASKPGRGRFAISPVIADPTNFVIAKDAFLWMAKKDGQTLPDEALFVSQFGCLRETGAWCKF